MTDPVALFPRGIRGRPQQACLTPATDDPILVRYLSRIVWSSRIRFPATSSP